MSKPSSALRKYTRYVQGGMSTVSSTKIGWWERSPTFSQRADDDYVIQSLPHVYEGREDLLAFDLYGRNDLGWVILEYNFIVDINEELVAGVRLVLPTKERLFSSMLIKAVNYEEDDV